MEIELPKPLETDRAADEHKLFCGEVVAEVQAVLSGC